MKKIQCEVCGGTSLLKMDNGTFECQSCGIQYSDQQIKKLLVEIESTAELDNKDKIENLYKLARRAKDMNDVEETIKYYEMILIEQPDCWEAMLYSASFKAMQGTIGSIIYDAQQLQTKIKHIIEVIKATSLEKSDILKCVKEAYSAILNSTNFLYTVSLNKYTEKYDRYIKSDRDSRSYSRFKEHRLDYMNRVYACCSILNEFGNCLENSFPENDGIMEFAIKAWNKSLEWNRETCQLDTTSQYAKAFNIDQAKYTPKVKNSTDDVSNADNNQQNTQEKGNDGVWTFVAMAIIIFLFWILPQLL